MRIEDEQIRLGKEIEREIEKLFGKERGIMPFNLPANLGLFMSSLPPSFLSVGFYQDCKFMHLEFRNASTRETHDLIFEDGLKPHIISHIGPASYQGSEMGAILNKIYDKGVPASVFQLHTFRRMLIIVQR